MPVQNSRKLQYPAVIITGVQRSGTTLLRLLLNNHSQIAIPEEAGFLMPYLNKRTLMSSAPLSKNEKRTFLKYLSQNKQYKRWKMEAHELDFILDADLTMKEIIGYLYGIFAGLNGKQICGDKSPSFIRKLDLLSQAFPKARLVHIVRDGRDAHLSLKKLNIPYSGNIAVASLEWRVKVSLIQKTLEKLGDRAIELRYEDLLADPVRTLTQVCAFLDLSFEEDMLNFWEHSEEFIDSAHSELIFKPLDSGNSQKWKTCLPEKNNREYEFFSRKTLIRYGYPILNEGTSLRDGLEFCIDLLIHLPLRILRIMRIALTMKLAGKLGLEHDDEGLVLRRYKLSS